MLIAECHYAECHCAESRHAVCHCAECFNADCHNGECRYAEFHSATTAADLPGFSTFLTSSQSPQQLDTNP